MSPDFHSAAFWYAGRSVFAVRRGLSLGDLDIRDPDATLTEAAKEIAASTGSLSLAVGAVAVRQGAALNPDWRDATAPLDSFALRPRMRQARKFVADNHGEILRLARTLLSERQLSVAMLGWILNSKLQREAA